MIRREFFATVAATGLTTYLPIEVKGGEVLLAEFDVKIAKIFSESMDRMLAAATKESE